MNDNVGLQLMQEDILSLTLAPSFPAVPSAPFSPMPPWKNTKQQNTGCLFTCASYAPDEAS